MDSLRIVGERLPSIVDRGANVKMDFAAMVSQVGITLATIASKGKMPSALMVRNSDLLSTAYPGFTP